MRSPAFAGNQVQIIYDGDGARVRKLLHTPTNVITTLYLVDDQNPSGYAQVLEELTTISTDPQLLTPAVTRVYTYDYALLSQQQLVNGQWQLSFYGYDEQGSVRYLTDVNGNLTDTYDYDAFGNLVQQSGATPNNYLFGGEQYDWDLGLYYLRARYMNPETGRFHTRDPFEGYLDEPLSLNGYLYANADGVNNSDPTGYENLWSQQIAQGVRGVLQTIARQWHRFRNARRSACRIVNTAEKIQNAYGTAQNAYQKVEMARQLAALGIAAGQQGISGADMARIVFEEAFELQGLDLVRMRDFDLKEVLGTLDTPCFTAGTLIATEHGLRPIETLKAGDQVWALGQGTAETALKPITQTISREVTNLVILTVGTERIETTAEHPFWVRDEGWVRAGELQSGNQLRARSGEWLPIASTESRAGRAMVFNFEVGDFHTYLVGEGQYAVHNPSWGGAGTRGRNQSLITALMRNGWKPFAGGGITRYGKETYFPNPAGGLKGGRFCDISLKKGNRTLHVNTVDHRRGVPTPREAAAAADIRSRLSPNSTLILVPK